ncbi:MAG: hypothetical protein MHM6MM_002733 [Cercozoa sp. M6MM]
MRVVLWSELPQEASGRCDSLRWTQVVRRRRRPAKGVLRRRLNADFQTTSCRVPPSPSPRSCSNHDVSIVAVDVSLPLCDARDFDAEGRWTPTRTETRLLQGER